MYSSIGDLALALVATAMFGLATHSHRREHTLTGDVRLHRSFRSRFLEPSRDIIVYLPPGYKRGKTKRYPVLYMHDGQNLFDGATAFIPGKDWQVDETAERLIKSHAIEPLIVVGIYNTGLDRVDEYTPTRDEGRQMGGKADLYGRLIVEELKPFIDSNYRTLPDREHTALAGSSLGGLVTLHIGLTNACVFSKLAVLSPSAWWDNRVITRFVQSLPGKLPLQIWLDIGTHEGTNGDAVREVSLLRDALVEKGWTAGVDLQYHEVGGGVHDEAAWAQRVGPILRFLFPR
jgi:predicted alpha/beta superfamily hydrolase